MHAATSLLWIAALAGAAGAVAEPARPAAAVRLDMKNLRARVGALDDAALCEIGSLQQLRELDVSGHRVTAAGVAALERELPRLRVRF